MEGSGTALGAKLTLRGKTAYLERIFSDPVDDVSRIGVGSGKQIEIDEPCWPTISRCLRSHDRPVTTMAV
jgi:hypothetical protein